MIIFIFCVLLLIISLVLLNTSNIDDFALELIIAIISMCILFMIIFISIAQLTCNANNLKNVERYNTLIYKIESSTYKDDFGLVNNEVINEIEQWNEDYMSYKHYSESPFTNIFYPKRMLKNVDRIDIEQIF